MTATNLPLSGVALCLLAACSCASLVYGPPVGDVPDARVDVAAEGVVDAPADPRDCGVADLSSDPRNCGRCGVVCATRPGTVINECVMGACRPTCTADFGDCDGDPSNGCEDTLMSEDHCGACPTACPPGDVCVPPPPPSTGVVMCRSCGREHMPCCHTTLRCATGLRCTGLICEI